MTLCWRWHRAVINPPARSCMQCPTDFPPLPCRPTPWRCWRTDPWVVPRCTTARVRPGGGAQTAGAADEAAAGTCLPCMLLPLELGVECLVARRVGQGRPPWCQPRRTGAPHRRSILWTCYLVTLLFVRRMLVPVPWLCMLVVVVQPPDWKVAPRRTIVTRKDGCCQL